MSKTMYDKAMQALACIDKVTDEDDYYTQHIAIDTWAFLEFLVERADVVGVVDFYDEHSDELLADLIGRELKYDNTYNYNEPFTHAMATVQAKQPLNENAPYILALAPCIAGDVRGNYGAYIVLRFDRWWDYLELCDEFYNEHSHTIELNGQDVTVTYSGAGECYTLTCENECVTDAFVPEPWDEADYIKSVKQELTRQGKE